MQTRCVTSSTGNQDSETQVVKLIRSATRCSPVQALAWYASTNTNFVGKHSGIVVSVVLLILLIGPQQTELQVSRRSFTLVYVRGNVLNIFTLIIYED